MAGALNALRVERDDGVIDEVLHSLKSGKEATVYVVRSGVQTRCAEVWLGGKEYGHLSAGWRQLLR